MEVPQGMVRRTPKPMFFFPTSMSSPLSSIIPPMVVFTIDEVELSTTHAWQPTLGIGSSHHKKAIETNHTRFGVCMPNHLDMFALMLFVILADGQSFWQGVY
jgi:hypothetical protein